VITDRQTCVYQLLQEAVATSGPQPAIVYYQEREGGDPDRIELSYLTLANWVAKIANLMRDGLGLDEQSSITLDLPAHWLTAAWLIAAESLPIQRLSEGGDLLVTDDPASAGARSEVVLCHLDLWGLASHPELPGGVIDFNSEVRAYGDHFTPQNRSERALPHLELQQPGARVLSTATEFPEALLWSVLRTRGTLVLAPETLHAEKIANAEGATHFR
jgi:uncharacterized protein (TIGR03089 family)